MVPLSLAVVFERGTNCWNDGNYINISDYARNVYLDLLSLVHVSAASGRVFDSKTIDETGWEKFQRLAQIPDVGSPRLPSLRIAAAVEQGEPDQ